MGADTDNVVQLCRDSVREDPVLLRALDYTLQLGIVAAVVDVAGEPGAQAVQLSPLDYMLPRGVYLEYREAPEPGLWLVKERIGAPGDSTLIESDEQLAGILPANDPWRQAIAA